MIEVDPTDPTFTNPTKPIGPFYDSDTAEELRRAMGWAFHADSDAYRRAVPSPKPKRIFELDQIRWMLEDDAVVICAGGGGIPTMYDEERRLVGIEADIDKDHVSGLLATGPGAHDREASHDVDAQPGPPVAR